MIDTQIIAVAFCLPPAPEAAQHKPGTVLIELRASGGAATHVDNYTEVVGSFHIN